MGVDTTAYKVVLTLHILCAIVGFGGVLLNALYGRESMRRQGPSGLAITEANYFVSTVAEKFIYAVFVLGVVLVILSDEVFTFEQTWVWLAMLLYAIGIALSHGALFPTVRRMKALMAELVAMGPPPAGSPTGGPPPQSVEIESLGKRLAIVDPTLQVILVVILGLMIWKPGF